MSVLDSSTSTWARWRYAAKPDSWLKLVVPALLGQALGVLAVGARVPGDASWGALGFGVAFTAFDLLAIVFLNDWGDRRVDAIKRRMFPDGCSPKTIPDGILPARALLAAGLVALFAMVGSAIVGAVLLDRPHLWVLGLLAALMFQLYTFGPVRANYRGGGEFVEALGVGAILPWIHAYSQSGMLWHPVYAALGGFVVLSFGSALASGLSDEQSDREGGKRTFTTMWGNPAVRRATEWCLVLGALAWIVCGFSIDALAPVAAILASVVVALHGLALRRSSAVAVTNAFREQGLYKRQLHLGIWRGASVFAVLQLVWSHLG